MNDLQNKIEKFKNQSGELKDEFKKQTLGYIVGAIGLVAALAWNEAIKGLIEYLFPMVKGGVWAKFLYALVITFVAVIITMYLVRIFKKDEKSQN